MHKKGGGPGFCPTCTGRKVDVKRRYEQQLKSVVSGRKTGTISVA